MRILLALLAAVVLTGANAPPAAPAEPGARTQDIDERTREVAKTLRCVVCKNQSIADSDAALAKDLKNVVRERIVEGDTNEEAQEYVVARYGEFVLLQPRLSWQNLALWILPAIVLALGVFGAWRFITAREKGPAVTAGLSDEERAELDRLRGR